MRGCEIKQSFYFLYLTLINPDTNKRDNDRFLIATDKDFPPDFITFLRHHIAQIENQ